MKPKSISALILEVADMDKTVAFYEQLGFRIGQNDGSIAVAYINWFSVEFHLKDTTNNSPKDGPVVLISVALDEYYQAIIAAGLTPGGEPAKTRHGRREFSLLDPNGYRLVFFEKK